MGSCQQCSICKSLFQSPSDIILASLYLSEHVAHLRAVQQYDFSISLWDCRLSFWQCFRLESEPTMSFCSWAKQEIHRDNFSPGDYVCRFVGHTQTGQLLLFSVGKLLCPPKISHFYDLMWQSKLYILQPVRLPAILKVSHQKIEFLI